MLGRVVVLVLLASCHRAEDENLGLAQPKESALALDRLDEPASLLAALAQPGTTSFDLQRTMELSRDGKQDRIDEVVRFDTNGRAFHLVHDLDHPLAVAYAPAKSDNEAAPRDKVDPLAQGMEAVALDGQLYVRPRYGRFVQRRPEPGELSRLRALAEQVVGDDLELLLPYAAISVTDGAVRTVTITKGTGHPPPDADPRRAWRSTLEVTELSGTLELDAKTGTLRSAKLDARYRFKRDDGVLASHVTLVQTPRAGKAITAPDNAIGDPHRARPTLERNVLLEGLAPPTGTSSARQP